MIENIPNYIIPKDGELNDDPERPPWLFGKKIRFPPLCSLVLILLTPLPKAEFRMIDLKDGLRFFLRFFGALSTY